MQKNATLATRYEVLKRPTAKDHYAQRIPMWEVVQRLGNANRSDLLRELRKVGYVRPNGAPVDEAYCRIELTDMTRRGFLRRVSD